MQRSCMKVLSGSAAVSAAAAKRGFSISSSSSRDEKIVASVLFERLPVVVPKIHPIEYAFRDFSFRWGQQFRRIYPDQLLTKSDSRGTGDFQVEFEPAPRITEADETNNKREPLTEGSIFSYMVKHMGIRTGSQYGTFLIKCMNLKRRVKESALESVLGDLSQTYFVGNAPMGHLDLQSFKRFFFKSQVIAANKFDIKKCKDFVWVTKDELLEYFPQQAEYLTKMIIS